MNLCSQVIGIDRIENPGLLENYEERKRKLQRQLQEDDVNNLNFKPVEYLPGSRGPVITTNRLSRNGFLYKIIEPQVHIDQRRKFYSLE